MTDLSQTSSAMDESLNAGANELVCACIGLTRDKLGEILVTEPGMTFENLMRTTGAGGKCTACMLDLEYYFVSLSRTTTRRAGSPELEKKERRSFKRMLFDLLDAISPLQPIRLADRMPLLLGPGIEQYIWIANQPMTSDKPISAPPIDISLVVRNSDGRIIESHAETLLPGSYLRRRIGADLTIPNDGSSTPCLAAASVEIVRRAATPGFRGTTRPQIEIVSTGGNCAVHSQRPGQHKEQWVTVLHRPETERIFITVVNPNDTPVTASFTYPFPLDSRPADCKDEQITIPAQGAHCHEILLNPAPELEGVPVGVRWHVSGPYKSHLICADPALTRFSIDHV